MQQVAEHVEQEENREQEHEREETLEKRIRLLIRNCMSIVQNFIIFFTGNMNMNFF